MCFIPFLGITRWAKQREGRRAKQSNATSPGSCSTGEAAQELTERACNAIHPSPSPYPTVFLNPSLPTQTQSMRVPWAHVFVLHRMYASASHVHVRGSDTDSGSSPTGVYAQQAASSKGSEQEGREVLMWQDPSRQGTVTPRRRRRPTQLERVTGAGAGAGREEFGYVCLRLNGSGWPTNG
ncbi:hypothetical protein BDN70DRAFT_937361 [Pholiota conissans]|uniref:Uncharacterized protein n=1 Tax=Pholiota conissans TaxID=109636 RepID=A0A9P5YR31_9AGAR|nr:hypothetical protein BDN70DRAFT_937361 [Pholiota conissans]